MNRSRLAGVAAAMLAAAAFTACGAPGTAAVSYAPAAYGQNGQCYYVDSPAEATALLAAGLCPAGWIPTPAPLGWEEEYWAWYSSPAYYGTYIPAAHRTTYINVTVVHFGSAHSADITRLSKTAAYKGSNGKTVVGPTGKMTFGGGPGRVAPTLGGGNARGGVIGGATGAPAPTGAAPKATLGGGNARRTTPPKVVPR